MKNTTVGVVGGGNMGSGIAQKYATEGFPTVVVDVDEAAAARGRDRVKATLDEAVQRKIFDAARAEAILGRMTFTADRDRLKGAALVIEAVFEDKAVKQELFRDLARRLGPDVLLATNTSSFYVDDVATGVDRPERVLGLHYFYHPAKNRLVEVVPGKRTSPDAVRAAWAIQEQVGKTPIASQDAPGFVVNRFFVPWLNEAMRIVDEGVADIATVEAAAKESFGVGMGPFELMNVTGPPITLHAATTLGTELGAFYAPSPSIKPLVEKKAVWPLGGAVDDAKKQAVADRLWAVVFHIATRVVFDEGVCTAEDLDLGARVGLRWPKGPFEVMNEQGVDRALRLVEQLVAKWPDQQVSPTLRKGAPIPLRLVTTRVDDGVGTLTIERPDALNALNEAVVAQLAEGFDRLVADPQVRGIVIAGRGKAFVAGADTKFFVDRIEHDDVPRIVKFASNGQDVFRKIDLSPKPVVCRLHGLSLGGGSELALACDFIVATAKGTLGFPETGIGIYPGLGGTQRSARRVGVPLARWLVLTGDVVDAKTAQAIGLIDDVVDEAQLDEACRRRALSGETRAERAPPSTTPPGWEATATAFAAPLEVIAAAAASDEKVAKAAKKLSFKAPRALQAADALVRAAATDTLADGLQAETAGLDAIFRTKDALEGLSSVGVRRPTFTGA